MTFSLTTGLPIFQCVTLRKVLRVANYTGNNGVLLYGTLMGVIILLEEGLRISRLQPPCQLKATTA